MKIEIETEETEAYAIGFKHGLEIGVDLNPFNKEIERNCYVEGYYAGVREYCDNDQYPEDKKCLTT